VELEIVERASDSTIGRVLKKTLSSCRFPPRFDPGFPLRTDPAG
jgi:hypothetical protein